MDVLLIEDNVVVRAILAEMLDDAGLTVAELDDGEALFNDPQVLVLDRPRVIVTDVDLGEGCHDGVEVAAQARRRWEGVGVVFLTGRPSNLHGHALGRRDRFLPKPLARSSLVRTVSGLLQS
jgi:DNA-binding response OmpR family regulator